jgi:hypothetical protein
MKRFASVVRLTAIAFTIGCYSTPASAADGKPFLMKIGTGGSSATTSIPSDGNFHSAGSVSIAPKKSGFCAVSASTNMLGGGSQVAVTISTAPDAVGPWSQFHNYSNSSFSVAITQAFVITKDVPVTFYLNVMNGTGSTIISETTRIWTICSAVKDPVLP